MSSVQSMGERPSQAPSSPRSLLACKKAAVDPNDLVYKDLKQFEKQYKDSAIAKIHFDKYESQRQQDISSVKSCYYVMQQNGISEAEYLLMGSPSTMLSLVSKFSQSQQVDKSGIERANKIAQEQMQKQLKREAEAKAFLAKKEAERTRAADEAAARLRELERQAAEKAEQERVELEKRNAEFQKMKQQKIEQEKEYQLRYIQKQEEKERYVYEKLELFKEKVSLENSMKRELNDTKRSQAKHQFHETQELKNMRYKQKYEEDEQRRREHQQYLEEKLNESIRQRYYYFEETRSRIEMNERNTKQRKQAQSEMIRIRQYQADEKKRQDFYERQRQMKEVFAERERQQKEHQDLLRQRHEYKRNYVFSKNYHQADNYEQYANTILLADKLRFENKRIEQETRRKQAQRKVELMEFEKQKKAIEMKHKVELYIYHERELQAERNAVLAAKLKLAAQKQKEEIERIFYKKGKIDFK